jgi:hypothetical protein
MCPNLPERPFLALFQLSTPTGVVGTDLLSSKHSSRLLKAIMRTTASKKWTVIGVRVKRHGDLILRGSFRCLRIVLLIYFAWGIENLPENFSQFVDAVRSVRERTFRTNPSGKKQSDWIFEFLNILGESINNIDDIKFSGYKVVSGFDLWPRLKVHSPDLLCSIDRALVGGSTSSLPRFRSISFR